jgi:hypothetical protein
MVSEQSVLDEYWKAVWESIRAPNTPTVIVSPHISLMKSKSGVSAVTQRATNRRKNTWWNFILAQRLAMKVRLNPSPDRVDAAKKWAQVL